MKTKYFFIIALLLVTFFYSCNQPIKTQKIALEEKAGIARDLEYVKITLADHHENVIFLKEKDSDQLIRGEKLNQILEMKDSVTYVFPVSIKANEKKIYEIIIAEQQSISPKLKVSGEGLALKIENNTFIADFNTNDEKVKKGLYPGQLAGIFIKNKGVLLERRRNNMHWAPNFQKDGQEYKTIGHVDSKGGKITQNNSYLLEMNKSGSVNDYEEIDLFGQYNFFADLPYFLYTSTMSFNKDVELLLLRNDEMTLDSLFTHLVFPVKGQMKSIDLYDLEKIDSLTKAPLADDLEWLGFINEAHGYGLISIRLAYDNHNADGGESPMYKQHTKITKSGGNGRYWNRRLIHDQNTIIPKGSTYYEKNAYLVLDDLANLDKKIGYYKQCLMNPIVVSSVSE